MFAQTHTHTYTRAEKYIMYKRNVLNCYIDEEGEVDVSNQKPHSTHVESKPIICSYA